jgi:hypothetical protein
MLAGGKYGKAKWLAAMLCLRSVENRNRTRRRAETVSLEVSKGVLEPRKGLKAL